MVFGGIGEKQRKGERWLESKYFFGRTLEYWMNSRTADGAEFRAELVGFQCSRGI